ncbi:PREDICTED: melatonin-related receptor [Elephantulus edwardii]|uniref:melatonin-related receptor n=1 Tax=Elephantulus edwardii TaxID=28737 RepID=UPI0003F0C246|nr:PREDICTED: melatonin-related receptor [Elephantulus edwardii]
MGTTLAEPTASACTGWELPEPDYPPALVTFMFCAMVVTIVVDLIGNSMVILAVSKNRKLRNSGNIFVVSLSIADMLVALYAYPLMLHAMSVGDWDLGHLQCQMVGLITGLSEVGSTFNLIAIAVNRYCYICHSLKYERLFSVRNTFFYLVGTWVMTLVAVLPNVYIGTIDYDPHTYSCVFKYLNHPILVVVAVCVHVILPLFMVGFCYVQIWMQVQEARTEVRKSPRNLLAETQNFLTMFVIFILFAVCRGPLNVLTVVVALSPRGVVEKIPNWLHLAAYFIAYFNRCLNAVVYGIFNENFRREYALIFHALRHPVLFVSGTLTDIRETWEARAWAQVRARAQTQEQEQEKACTAPVVEEVPMSAWNIPLPGALGQPDLDSKSALEHKSVTDCSKPSPVPWTTDTGNSLDSDTTEPTASPSGSAEPAVAGGLPKIVVIDVEGDLEEVVIDSSESGQDGGGRRRGQGRPPLGTMLRGKARLNVVWLGRSPGQFLERREIRAPRRPSR